MGYTKTAIVGFSWLTAFRVVTRAVSLGKTAVVARFLSPSQFGLFGIATILLSFVEVMTETGVNVFLVQQKKDIDEYLDSAWIVSIIRGTIIAVVMFVSAPFVAGFFNAPDATTLLYAMSLVPFLRGFINPAVVIFQKELKFKTEFFFRTFVLFIEILVTFVLLFLNPAPISLIWGLVAGVITEVTLSYVVFKQHPRLRFNTGYLKKLFNHGKWITGASIFNYGFERGDDIVVGRLLGTQSLGIYDMAYRFSMLPITEVAEIINKVTFPVYVKISDDYKRLKRAYVRTISVISLLVITFGLILFIFPEQIIRIVLGEQWLEAVEVLRVLAVLGVIRAISLSISSFLLALQKQKYLTFTTLIGLVGMLVTIVPLINIYGLVGAAYAACLGYLLSVPVIVYYSITTLNSVKNRT